METLPRSTTFIVRINDTADGPLTGTVERARTGEKQRFAEVQDVGALIARMLRADPGHGADGAAPE
jgi:hypothetical protein